MATPHAFFHEHLALEGKSLLVRCRTQACARVVCASRRVFRDGRAMSASQKKRPTGQGALTDVLVLYRWGYGLAPPATDHTAIHMHKVGAGVFPDPTAVASDRRFEHLVDRTRAQPQISGLTLHMKRILCNPA